RTALSKLNQNKDFLKGMKQTILTNKIYSNILQLGVHGCEAVRIIFFSSMWSRIQSLSTLKRNFNLSTTCELSSHPPSIDHTLFSTKALFFAPCTQGQKRVVMQMLQ